MLTKPRSGLTVRPTNHCCGQPASQDNGRVGSPTDRGSGWPIGVSAHPHPPIAPTPTQPKVYLLQEHPGLRGTPLAMLAAQCNKLSSMSPPPLADAAVGKGFHPWKKGGGRPEQAASVSRQGGTQSTPTSNQPSTASTFSTSPQHRTKVTTCPLTRGSSPYAPLK